MSKRTRVSKEEWELFKQERNLTYGQLSRILFPQGLEPSKKDAKSRRVYQVYDETNVS